MKFTVILSLLLTVTACGRKRITKYVENPFDNSNNDARLTDLESRVTQLEDDFASSELSAAALSVQVNSNTSSIASLQAQIDVLEASLSDAMLAEDAHYQSLLSQVNALQAGLNTSNATISSIQVTMNNLQSQLTALSSGDNVVKYLDPCGDYPGYYDEILMVTSSGKVIAYFEDGGRRFLSVLVPNVYYQTTDKQSCTFRVNNSGNLI
jgi:peptidoglycan hydrolase CwlO-like protein